MKLLFIDPASISTGWALFEGTRLTRSGTVAAPKQWGVWRRFECLYIKYAEEFELTSLDEVHMELLPRSVNHMATWSVGVLGLLFHELGVPVVEQDIPITSWQKHFKEFEGKSWADLRSEWRKRGYTSEDEYAAVSMGRFWVGRKVGSK